MAEIICDKGYLHKVEIIESERGWGSKIEDIKFFEGAQEAKDFVAEFNSKNTANSAPDWYMSANYVGEILITTIASKTTVAEQVDKTDITRKLISKMMYEYQDFIVSLKTLEDTVQSKMREVSALREAISLLPPDCTVAIVAINNKINECVTVINENAHMFNRTPETTAALSQAYIFFLKLLQQNCPHEMTPATTDKDTGIVHSACIHCLYTPATE